MTKNSVRDAPAGRYAVPSRGNCLACHGGAAVPVLDVGTLQLSPDRDPLAAHGRAARSGEVDLQGLVARGWLRRLPAPPARAAAHRRRHAGRTLRSAEGVGPPPHSHPWDESYFVLRGKVEFGTW